LTRPKSWTDREVEILASTQRWIGSTGVLTAARAASRFGEHAGGWLGGAAVLATLDRDRRTVWVRAGAAAVGAHAAAVVLKRVVRRRRPDSERVTIGVGTPSALSFPSAHAASTTAFLVASTPIIPGWVAGAGSGAMAASRLVLGVHYPTDVAVGAVIGATSGWAARAVRVDRGQGQ
jgi:membrane-associated phospholipid phosphatase